MANEPTNVVDLSAIRAEKGLPPVKKRKKVRKVNGPVGIPSTPVIDFEEALKKRKAAGSDPTIGKTPSGPVVTKPLFNVYGEEPSANATNDTGSVWHIRLVDGTEVVGTLLDYFPKKVNHIAVNMLEQRLQDPGHVVIEHPMKIGVAVRQKDSGEEQLQSSLQFQPLTQWSERTYLIFRDDHMLWITPAEESLKVIYSMYLRTRNV